MTSPVRTTLSLGSRSRLPGAAGLFLLPLALVLMAMAPESAAAQYAGAQNAGAQDDRWLPWVGCWEPSSQAAPDAASDWDAPDPASAWDAPATRGNPAPGAAAPGSARDGARASAPATSARLLVCVTPVAGGGADAAAGGATGGVHIETFLDGESVSLERFVADGTPVATEEGGCEGTRQARWSADARRVYLESDLACGADARRTTSGLFAMGADGMDWIEIQAVGTRMAGEPDDAPYLSVRRFQAASRATLARHERAEPNEGRALAVETSRRAAARSLGTDAVIETAQVAGPDVATALVAEMGHPYDLDANALRDLKSQGSTRRSST
jgi:hypothetical protein